MITIEKKSTSTEKVFLVPPMFWKSFSTHIGLLDDKTVVSVYISENRVCIENDAVRFMLDRITNAHDNYEKSNESEFFSAYDEAMEHLRLTPEIRENAGEYHEPEEKEELIPVENKEY